MADDDPEAGDPVAPVAPIAPITHVLRRGPPVDEVARAVSLARVGGALFAGFEAVTLGRYELRERVGAGGMGVVWSAWDPELGRHVAIKLVAAATPAARARVVAEGQALARLAHPHVVPVFDVGVVDARVYLVMEWVRGETLRAYAARPRSVRELVAVYREAGEGLAAAHAAGLVHRDFKPDNAVRGDDGRVRVLDFGLARDAAAGSGEIAGTPRYMAPEQRAGEPPTPAVDQYALAVSLREAVASRRAEDQPAAVPRWLDAVLARATAEDPAARYPTLRELLRALGHDPATVWRRRAVVALAAGGVIAAFVAGSQRAAAPAVRCGGGEAELAPAWTPATRFALAVRRGAGDAYARHELARLDDELARYAVAWVATQRATCAAHDRGTLAPALYERAVGCMIRARAAFSTAVDVVAGAGPLRAVAPAVAGLPSLAACRDAAPLPDANPPAPGLAPIVAITGDLVERARIHALAARPDAAGEAANAVRLARATGHAGTIARGLIVEGMARTARDGRPLFAEATRTALDAGDSALAVEAFAREVFAAGRAGAALPEGLALVEALGRGAGPRARFARALLHNNLGVARIAVGDRAGAQRALAAALAEADAARELDPELANIAVNLARVTDDPAARDRLFARGIRELAALLGPHHPHTEVARVMAGLAVADPARAAAAIYAACADLERWHPHSRERGPCWYIAAWVEDERRLASATMRRALATLATDSDEHAIAAAYVARDPAVAPRMRALADRLAGLRDAPWWRREPAVDAYLVAARAWGRDPRARESLERARALLGELSTTQLHLDRKRARIRALLAQ